MEQNSNVAVSIRKSLKKYYLSNNLKSLREEPFLIPGTRVEGISEELKKFLNLGSIWQKVLVHQRDLLGSFGTPTTKLKIA